MVIHQPREWYTGFVCRFSLGQCDASTVSEQTIQRQCSQQHGELPRSRQKVRGMYCSVRLPSQDCIVGTELEDRHFRPLERPRALDITCSIELRTHHCNYTVASISH